MRHGIAAERDHWHGPDANRPLTAAGTTKTARAARGLQLLQPHLDLIAGSPLLRAAQTASLVQKVYNAPLEVWPELESADFDLLLARLRAHQELKVVLLVGHEPGLSQFAAQLLAGRANGFSLQFKKAAVCALEVAFEPQASASLLWFAPSRLLRAL